MLVLPMRDGSRYKEWLLIAELQRDKSLQGTERGGTWLTGLNRRRRGVRYEISLLT